VDLPNILLISAGFSIGATVIAVLVALRSAREARTAIFPIVREEESNRAKRARVSILVWAAITALLLGGWLASLRLIPADDAALVSDSAPAQPSETVVVAFATQSPETTMPTDIITPLVTTSALTPESPTDTPAIAMVVTSPTPVPAVATPTPTEAPTSIPPTATFTPPPPRGPAPPGSQLGPIEFATEIGSPLRAINPDTVFPSVKIYAVYPYSGMQNGVNFAAVWFQDGAEIARDERQWEWGLQGRSYSFLIPPGEGQYKLDLYVNDSLLATGSFEIR
jgi:hypothetical protein